MKLNIAKDELDFAQKSTFNEDFWQNEKSEVSQSLHR